MPSNPKLSLPKFKVEDLVSIQVDLPVLATGSRDKFVIDENNPRIVHNNPIPVDPRPIENLPIRAGTALEIVGVFPTGNSEEMPGKRYKLRLDQYYLDQLSPAQRELTESEFGSLNAILDEQHPMPFFTFANEDELTLLSASDTRTPGERVIQAWTEDDDFPWTVTVEFPDADQTLCYYIDSGLCNDESANDDEYGFFLGLSPLHVGHQHNILDLKVRPSNFEDNYETPRIDFSSERKATCAIDPDNMTITITIHFRTTIDLTTNTWHYEQLER